MKNIETLFDVFEVNPGNRIGNCYGTMKLVRAKDGRLFSAKANHPCAGGAIPLAHEVYFHVVARANEVRVPAGAFLMINGTKQWGAEYLKGRESLVDYPSNEQIDTATLRLLEMTFRQSDAERKHYLRGMFLDVALLNSDRPAWNLLGQDLNGLLHVTFFDHDRTLGWRASHTYADTVVGSPDREDARFDNYLGSREINQLVLAASTKEECFEVFAGLDLSDRILTCARDQVPVEWLSPNDFPKREAGIRAWIKHLQRNFEKVHYPRIIRA